MEEEEEEDIISGKPRTVRKILRPNNRQDQDWMRRIPDATEHDPSD